MSLNFILKILSLFFISGVLTIIVSEKVRTEGKKISSFGAGIALSYVFLHLLPELSEYQNRLLEGPLHNRIFQWFEQQLYMVSLFGVLLFYFLEGLRRTSTGIPRNVSAGGELITFCVYHFVIGNLITSNSLEWFSLIMITFALSAHLFGTNIDLAEHYGRKFIKIGIPCLIISFISGALLGLLFDKFLFWIALGFAFISGSIIMITFNVEMPKPELHRNSGFVFGAVIYSALILIIYKTVG